MTQKLTQGERIVRLEQKVEDGFKTIFQKINENADESKNFHKEVISRLEKMDNEKIMIARLQERVKLLYWILGVVGAASLTALVESVYNVI